MLRLRPAQPGDLDAVASWLRSARDCERWAGSRVAWPVDRAALPANIEWEACASWALDEDGSCVAFGQVVAKAARRLHIARLIAHPDRRREGLGRRMAAHLVDEALARTPHCVSLNVAADNAAARELYRSLGFAEAERPADEPASESLYLERR